MENVILDTDISNEVDDQFALSYLLRSGDKIKLEAITIAPFKSNKFVKLSSLEEGINMSVSAAERIIEMTCASDKLSLKQKIFGGASAYFDESKALSPAANKIIEVCERNEHTTVVCIGAITNLAVALFHRSDLAGKIKIIWLGGNSFLSPDNDEYNFRQDPEAVKFIWSLPVELVVIPVKNVSDLLSISIYELEHYLSDGRLGKYLLGVYRGCVAAHRKDEKNITGEAHALFDISAVAYVINPDWFDAVTIPAPVISEENRYVLQGNAERQITFVCDMNRNLIYRDLFEKIGGL